MLEVTTTEIMHRRRLLKEESLCSNLPYDNTQVGIIYNGMKRFVPNNLPPLTAIQNITSIHGCIRVTYKMFVNLTFYSNVKC